METTDLGRTGLRVSRLGIGLAELGGLQGEAGAEQASLVLNAALDSGINFLDTSSCYRSSEEHVGNSVAHRRDEYVLATKCGHPVGGSGGREWSAETIAHNIDTSLRRMKVEYVDLLQLHSCELEVLQRGEAVEALERARDAGKTRFIGYSGDEDAAAWAVDSGRFDTLQTSFSLVDQHARTRLLEPAEAAGMGVIIKRPIGNAVWGSEGSRRPAAYVERARAMAAMGPLPGAHDPILLAMGFLFAHPQVDTAIVGTTSQSHLRSNIEMLERGVAIAPEAVEELARRYMELDQDWLQLM